jgi:integrase
VVVTRFRIFLESRGLAVATMNGRLAAVRRLAYEAADAGLLSPELAASIRRVKGPKKLGVRLGNWLTADEARRFWQSPDPETLKGKRDRAILAILLGCGLRRRELADLEFTHLQQREEHWAIVDLVGKGGHIRTVPVPEWAKMTLDAWIHQLASIRGKYSVASVGLVNSGVMASRNASSGTSSSCMPRKPALLVSLPTT